MEDYTDFPRFLWMINPIVGNVPSRKLIGFFSWDLFSISSGYCLIRQVTVVFLTSFQHLHNLYCSADLVWHFIMTICLVSDTCFHFWHKTRVFLRNTTILCCLLIEVRLECFDDIWWSNDFLDLRSTDIVSFTCKTEGRLQICHLLFHYEVMTHTRGITIVYTGITTSDNALT